MGGKVDIIDISLGPGLPVQSVIRDPVDQELYKCDRWGEKQDEIRMEVVESTVVPGLWVLREKVAQKEASVVVEEIAKRGTKERVTPMKNEVKNQVKDEVKDEIVEQKKPFKRGAFKDRPRKRPSFVGSTDGSAVGTRSPSASRSVSGSSNGTIIVETKKEFDEDDPIGLEGSKKRKSWLVHGVRRSRLSPYLSGKMC